MPPENGLHALTDDRKGQHSISINDQWRICFRFVDGDAYDVEVCDYHSASPERSRSCIVDWVSPLCVPAGASPCPSGGGSHWAFVILSDGTRDLPRQDASAVPARAPELRGLTVGRESFAVTGPLTLVGPASYPVAVRRPTGLAPRCGQRSPHGRHLAVHSRRGDQLPRGLYLRVAFMMGTQLR